MDAIERLMVAADISEADATVIAQAAIDRFALRPARG